MVCLWLIMDVTRATAYTHFRWKCGSRLKAGRTKKAGNVMRLKTPTTTIKPKMDEAKMPERFCTLC